MNKDNVFTRYNFIVNGEFTLGLDGWTVNDRQKVTRQSGLWQGVTVGYMNAVNLGEGEQTIILAERPRPTPGRADYKLMFHYEAIQGAAGTLRIDRVGGPVDLELIPSREADSEPIPEPGEELQDLNLVPYQYKDPITVNPEEKNVTFTLMSPDNGGPGRPGAVRLAFMRVELHLEPLQLQGHTIDEEPQPVGETLRLCFGATHALELQPEDDSVWNATRAGLLVNGEIVDPENVLTVSPPGGTVQAIERPWCITCDRINDDREIERTLDVRSEYTAELYSLKTLCGHFQLDVIALKEAAYYPVIALSQGVELRVRVRSHYTEMPLAGREVTWTLKGATPADDIVLHRHFSDAEGEASFLWEPHTAGAFEIEASVDSYYKKEQARRVFPVRALQEDPWLSATFSLDGSGREWIWGGDTGYPCRGAMHEVILAFAQGHALADAELKLQWKSEYTPGGLGMTFAPELDSSNPVVGQGGKWKMTCGNRVDSLFNFEVRCSRLLESSPLQELHLAHNSLKLGEVKQPSRFPVVGGVLVPLQIQVLSTVPGVGAVTGVDVAWKLSDEPDQTLPTGSEGWSQYEFNPEEEGSFSVSAKFASPYEGPEVEHSFELKVLPENPLASLTKVTMAGKEAGTVGLLCFRNSESVELRVDPVGSTLLGEEFYLNVAGYAAADLAFEFVPPLNIPCKMIKEGLSWQVSSSSETSARFLLSVCHAQLPAYDLPGRLLSTTLEHEGTILFDDAGVDVASTVFPCLGAEHVLRFEPAHDSLLLGLNVAAKRVDPWGQALNVKLTPVEPQALQSDGLNWSLDARDSTESGTLALAFELPQANFTFPPIAMSLGHNRIEITESRAPTFDPIVGQTLPLEIKSQSFYTRESMPGLEVSFLHGDDCTNVATLNTGWAKFFFEATEPGNVTVVATVPSPYDGADAPSFVFNITVLAVAAASNRSMALPTPIPLAGSSLMALPQKTSIRDLEIVEVREPEFDPVVGESVWIAVRVRSSSTQRAASGAQVTFTAEQSPVSVITDGEGWAGFAYKAEQARDVEVIATLLNVEDEPETAPTHSFRFKSLAASGWEGARIQLNNEVPKIWGVSTLFPRITQAHTIRLIVDGPDNPLLGREICLGLKGHSSPEVLGVTTQPALGQSRVLTADGLSWQCNGTFSGAYNLQLAASRLLKQSPLNAISLGPMPPGELPADSIVRTGDQS
ncbi:hypothetical protein JRG42_10185 [Pseudomonas granadensis]|uniref:hypothetical protein n=1 Tax=Pseudomonas granadensis TaxID=1421430 RepID=UPI0019D2B135|nr:hypothetical protein [Pseudomonas granadensis]MBN6773990.1 hypothetical protein [Pseudomonas granadensis]MBN6804389.1 hypothetical protein [Pseudomonas granadensis]MBN6831535.1 hypothetical protein [Pseudomonas granadensis]MBN6839064.1 hypothetical protein [Pseudomonas granadensis]MBN6868320.1 hypothetical protein [Pseudomonas granadensis]